MSKPLSLKDINALRVLLNKAAKPPPITEQQRSAKRSAARIAFKAAWLEAAQKDYDAREAEWLKRFPGSTLFPLGAGFRPTK